MTPYRFSALGPDGKKRSGVIHADSSGTVRDQLIGKGLHPIGIRRALFTPPATLRPTEAEAARLAKTLAQLTGSGLSMAQALALIENRETGRLALLSREVRNRLVAGEPLSSALGAGSGSSIRLLQTLTRAGEAAGRQVDVLNDAARSLAASDQLKRRVLTLSLYPAFVIAVALGSIAIYAYAVLPALEPAFEGMGAELPAQTQAVLTFGAIMRIAIPAISGLIALGLLIWTLVPPLRAPLLDLGARALMRGRRSALADMIFANLTGRLAVMVQAGVPAAVAWRLASEPVTLMTLKRQLAAQSPRLMEGEALSRALAQIRSCPRDVAELVALGERSGRVAAALSDAAEQLAARSQEALERALSILTPLVIVLVGLLVGMITLMVFQGLLAISDAVGA